MNKLPESEEYSQADLKELERIKAQREHDHLASEDERHGYSWKAGPCKMFRGNAAKGILEYERTSRIKGMITIRFKTPTIDEWNGLIDRIVVLETAKPVPPKNKGGRPLGYSPKKKGVDE